MRRRLGALVLLVGMTGVGIGFGALAGANQPNVSVRVKERNNEQFSQPYQLRKLLPLPDYVTVGVEHRTRYETVTHQFRDTT